MWQLFRKKKIEKTQLPGKMPQEVEEYYKERRKAQSVVPFLLMLATLIVTLALSFGIFYGGKWAYKKIKGNNNTATTETTKPTKPAEAPKKPSANTQPESTPSNQNNTQAPSSAASSTPNTGPSAIPHTGPISDFN